jgi:hypothetical protein
MIFMEKKIVQFPVGARAEKGVSACSALWSRAATEDSWSVLESAVVAWLSFWGVVGTLACVYQLSGSTF